jgi:hypothetical protein
MSHQPGVRNFDEQSSEISVSGVTGCCAGWKRLESVLLSGVLWALGPCATKRPVTPREPDTRSALPC